MKKALLSLVIFLSILPSLNAAHFKADKELIITKAEYGDFYVAGGEVDIKSVIQGDLVMAGGEVKVNDSVLGDALISGGEIFLNSFIGDDARIAGGEITISGQIQGDLIIFGGEITVTSEAEILGDLVCFGGHLELEGAVYGNVIFSGGEFEFESSIEGNLDVKSGNVDFKGIVGGDVQMSAEKLQVGEQAKCHGLISYWSGEGEVDLPDVGQWKWDDDLAMDSKDINWAVLGTILGLGFIAYWCVFIISAFLFLLFLQKFLGRYFVEAANNVKNSMVKSFGYGMIYFVVVPIISFILILMIIGLPIGIMTLGLYIMSLLFSTVVCGLTISHYFEQRSSQEWTFYQNIGYALLVVIILKIVFLIPLIGTLFKIVVLATVYGSFLMMILERQKSKN